MSRNNIYRGGRWQQILSKLGEDDEYKSDVAITRLKDKTPNNDNEEASGSSSGILYCKEPPCVKQIKIDKRERILLERLNTCKSNLKYPKSFSLSDLTVDNLVIGNKYYNSMPSLFNYPHEIIYLNKRSTGIDLRPEEYANQFPNNAVNQALFNHNTAPQKSLSLSDLTHDNQATYKLNKRSQSAPSVKEILEMGCTSPSLLLFTATLDNDDDHDPSVNDLDDGSTTNCETSDEEYGDMNEGRKRRHVARADEWKKNQAQRKRMRGETYLGYSKPRNEKMRQDQVRAAKELGQTCTSQFCKKSKLRGCSRFDEETRRSIHVYFWKKLNWDERRIYVRELITCSTTNRKTKGREESRREGTLNYFLPQKNSEGKIQVCKQMFLNTLSLKSTSVQTWVKKDRFHDVANDAHSAQSSQTNNLNNKTATLNNFLTSIPKMPSHYARKETKKLYIEPSYRTVTDLYNAYKCYCTDNNVLPAVSRYTFDKTFKEKNYALYTLKKDMCDTCIGYKEGNIDGHIFQEHIIKKNRARQEKEEDKKKAAKGEVIVLTMDLEAVKVCPYLTASALYFKTKLTCHNFTCFDLTTRQCSCYWFTETAADLTASTFASFIIDYLERHCLSKQKPIILFSDGCNYQNRNVILANALLNFSLKNKVTITQKFLEKGHTQMECDSVHAAIERKLTNREIYLPCDYVSATKEARTSCPYEVIQIDHSFVKNYADKSTWLYNSIRPGRKAGDPTVADIRAILYDQEEIIKVKLHFDQEWLELPLRPKRNKSIVTYAPLRSQMIPISASKYQHLQELKAVLPTECHGFYDSLPHS